MLAINYGEHSKRVAHMLWKKNCVIFLLGGPNWLVCQASK